MIKACWPASLRGKDVTIHVIIQYTILCCTISYHIILCYIALFQQMLYYIILYYTILCLVRARPRRSLRPAAHCKRCPSSGRGTQKTAGEKNRILKTSMANHKHDFVGSYREKKYLNGLLLQIYFFAGSCLRITIFVVGSHCKALCRNYGEPTKNDGVGS